MARTKGALSKTTIARTGNLRKRCCVCKKRKYMNDLQKIKTHNGKPFYRCAGCKEIAVL